MNFMSKIKAFFTIKGKREQMELVSAEINMEGAILHPFEDPERSFFVPSNNIKIFIGSDDELPIDDVVIVNNNELNAGEASPNDSADESSTLEEDEDFHIPNIKPRALSTFMPSKKRFTVMLYPDEHEMLMKQISDKGYKKAEYFLACTVSAKKQNMDSVYKRYTTEHTKRYQADLYEAKRAQAEDFMFRRAEAERTKVEAEAKKE